MQTLSEFIILFSKEHHSESDGGTARGKWVPVAVCRFVRGYNAFSSVYQDLKKSPQTWNLKYLESPGILP